ncbi:hypothetical protein FYK55_04550 [Roseiconus nitratireducens]|uniref:Uncharacterized protein n=1 Tax=Roseiconus nitratireducens TaxID=2605748 RepID=A0A5M6DIU6_9BACT|nr:hypothetical protein [Roseiconus nitratireducens]KAA5546170.1 hypothetical protein FYK55_04550 [Roseiconus nitratireducens]
MKRKSFTDSESCMTSKRKREVTFVDTNAVGGGCHRVRASQISDEQISNDLPHFVLIVIE